MLQDIALRLLAPPALHAPMYLPYLLTPPALHALMYLPYLLAPPALHALMYPYLLPHLAPPVVLQL